MKKLFLFIAVLIVGCSTGWKDQQKDFMFFTDIPIPIYSKMNKRKTSIIKDPNSWRGILSFDVSNKVRILFYYYAEEMEKFGWKKIAVLKGDFQNYSLTYTKGNRIAQLEFNFNQMSGTEVKITMLRKL